MILNQFLTPLIFESQVTIRSLRSVCDLCKIPFENTTEFRGIKYKINNSEYITCPICAGRLTYFTESSISNRYYFESSSKQVNCDFFITIGAQIQTYEKITRAFSEIAVLNAFLSNPNHSFFSGMTHYQLVSHSDKLSKLDTEEIQAAIKEYKKWCLAVVSPLISNQTSVDIDLEMSVFSRCLKEWASKNGKNKLSEKSVIILPSLGYIESLLNANVITIKDLAYIANIKFHSIT